MTWEPDLQVPLLLRVPGSTAGQRVTGLTEHVDLMPTLLQVAGIPVPDWAEGSSLLPLLDDPSAPGKSAVFSQARRGRLTAYSTRTVDHRYTRWLDATGHVQAEELYDHRTDLEEAINLASDADPAVLARLRALAPRANR